MPQYFGEETLEQKVAFLDPIRALPTIQARCPRCEQTSSLRALCQPQKPLSRSARCLVPV